MSLLLCDWRMNALSLLDGSAAGVGQSLLAACTLLHSCCPGDQTKAQGAHTASNVPQQHMKSKSSIFGSLSAA